MIPKRIGFCRRSEENTNDSRTMSQHFSLKAETRQRSGSSEINRMRQEGLLPAVIYGRSRDNANLKVSAREVSKLLGQSASENVLVDLEIDGEKKTSLALIKDVQHDYLADKILHVDFHAVGEDEHITASVPVNISGVAPGVKEGGLLEHMIHSIDVTCLPKDLPEEVTVDVGELHIGDSSHVRDIVKPEGVELGLDGDVVVALVAETRTTKSEKAGGGEGEKDAGEEGAEGEGAEGEADAS